MNIIDSACMYKKRYISISSVYPCMINISEHDCSLRLINNIGSGQASRAPRPALPPLLAASLQPCSDRDARSFESRAHSSLEARCLETAPTSHSDSSLDILVRNSSPRDRYDTSAASQSSSATSLLRAPATRLTTPARATRSHQARQPLRARLPLRLVLVRPKPPARQVAVSLPLHALVSATELTSRIVISTKALADPSDTLDPSHHVRALHSTTVPQHASLVIT